jgi:hypothetical protein
MQRRAYHALGRDEQCSFPAKIMSRLCLRWVNRVISDPFAGCPLIP